MHMGIGLHRHVLIHPHAAAPHTRPRSLRARSISITCSARSFGCAIRAARQRAIVRIGRAARMGAGDRPRVHASPANRSSRSGEEDSIAEFAELRQRRKRRRIGRAQSTVQRCALSNPRAVVARQERDRLAW